MTVQSRMTTTIPLAAKMKKRRGELGWTQIKASQELGVGLDTWRKLEQGAIIPNSVYLPIIERWLIVG